MQRRNQLKKIEEKKLVRIIYVCMIFFQSE